MPIDYSRFLGHSWTIFSRHRVLWALGFVMALGASVAAPLSILVNAVMLPLMFNLQFSEDIQSPGEIWARMWTQLWSQWGGWIGGGTIALGLVLLVGGFISAGGEAAIITTVDEIERTGQALRFRAAWQRGSRRWGPLWLLNLLVGVITLGLTVLASAPLIVGWLSLFREVSLNPDVAPPPGFALSMACSGLLFLPVLVMMVVLYFVRQLAAQAVVLDGAGVRESLAIGWRMLRHNVGASLVIAIASYVANYVASLIVGVISAVIILPIIGVGVLQLNNPAWSGIFVLLLIVGSILYWLVVAAGTGLALAFGAVLWTVFYRYRRGLPNSDLAPLPVAPYGGAYYGGVPYSVVPGGVPGTAPPPYPLTPPGPPVYGPPDVNRQ